MGGLQESRNYALDIPGTDGTLGSMSNKRGRGNQGPPKKSVFKVSGMPSTPTAPPTLAWIRVIAGPAFCLGGLGLIPVFFWTGVSIIYVGFVLCLVEALFEPLVR